MFRVLILGICILFFSARADETPQVAVASSLQFVMPVVVKAFQRESGFAPRITYGSSGNFVRQISQGAPFEMFLSADELYVEALRSAGLSSGRGGIYALGQLVFIKPKGSDLRLSEDLASVKHAIDSGQLRHFAIANPDHAPYGRAARETLISLGLWKPMQPFLVRGENASQALQFALSGSSQGGLAPYAMTFSPAVRARSEFIKVDPENHRPIRQRMVLMKNAGTRAELFYRFIGSPAAQAIFESYGFQIPSRAKNSDN